MKRKYFFFDIDGTLTDRRTHKIVDSAKTALELLKKNGHFVAIATGRAHYKALPFMKDVGIQNMVCAGGGALVLDEKLIENIPLDLMKAKALIHEAKNLGFGYLLMLDDSVRCYSENDLFYQQCGPRKEPTEYIYDKDLDIDALDTIYKIYLSIPASEEYKLTLRDTLGSLRFEPEYLIFQYDAKDQGILRMMNHLKAPIEDIVVFGDDTNDMVMFDPRWTSIAMGNATPELKEKASYVTDANVDDGIYNACKHFGWI